MVSADDRILKNLLTAWRCNILYNLFKEEDIELEDLKLLKYHHLNQLMKPYKMGIRIRFEYYLEKWRQQMGVPLKPEDIRNMCNCEKSSKNDENPSKNDENSRKRKESNHLTQNGQIIPSNSNNIISNGNTLPLPPQRNEKSPLQMLQSPPQTISENDTSNPTPVVVRNKRPRRNSTVDINASDYLETGNVTSETSMKRIDCPYSLAEILKKTGSKGETLIQYYKEHKEFTKVERNLLIHLICYFYKDNEFHMSLTRSHEIEVEILQLFPNEKLEYYRTDKRGRIYIKYTNMKNYKSAKRRTTDENCTKSDSNTNENTMEESVALLGSTVNTVVHSEDPNTWRELIRPELIKSEDKSDDDAL